MSAMRILLLVIALAATALVARYVIFAGADDTGGAGGEARSRPAQQLDNVRERAKELEGELQRNADRADQPAEGEKPQ